MSQTRMIELQRDLIARIDKLEKEIERLRAEETDEVRDARAAAWLGTTLGQKTLERVGDEYIVRRIFKAGAMWGRTTANVTGGDDAK